MVHAVTSSLLDIEEGSVPVFWWIDSWKLPSQRNVKSINPFHCPEDPSSIVATFMGKFGKVQAKRKWGNQVFLEGALGSTWRARQNGQGQLCSEQDSVLECATGSYKFVYFEEVHITEEHLVPVKARAKEVGGERNVSPVWTSRAASCQWLSVWPSPHWTCQRERMDSSQSQRNASY